MADEEKVLSIDKDQTKMQMLDKWLRDLVFPGKVSDFIQELSGSGDGNEIKRKVCFYTADHQYFINAIERFDGDANSYLGCQVSTRKPRAGEDWTRGNDLPDGPFEKDTWDKILNAIVCYEVVKLSKFQKPDEIPENIA